ncbi:MAG: TIGR00725 family protein [Nitrospirae bacterium]|nr:TIGR00725 family protein [Nitrospirota bacterium]MBF0519849.1 TIGR00725 family protein [Nitrospirota bacterium]MBF0535941.1 TIGR00725 family protein [Nitrospirota bacterium]MBF0618083.1 TIGR00725 family protein [Nitrospirota bacterium]
MIQIGVIGGRVASDWHLEAALTAGKLIAEKGGLLVTGGLTGVMEAASKGAKSAGGLTIGIVPQADKKSANSFVDITIATGLGIARNSVIAHTADALIAIGGEYGTLSEIAYGLQLKKPVVTLKSWDIPGTVTAKDVDEAVSLAFKLAISTLATEEGNGGL